jgi:hypothetical protein
MKTMRHWSKDGILLDQQTNVVVVLLDSLYSANLRLESKILEWNTLSQPQIFLGERLHIQLVRL